MSDKRLMILSLDDDAVSAIQSVANSMSYQVSHFKNPMEFHSVFDSFQPTLLIIDLNLGETDGVQLLTHLARLNCRAPIILIGKCDLNILYSAKSVGQQKKLSVTDVHTLPVVNERLQESFSRVNSSLHFIDSSKVAHAFESGQFILHYQPKIEIKTGRLMGMEALIRWQPPSFSLLTPDSFITIAEESGLIVPMTYWIIRQSLEEYKTLKLDDKAVTISINLSSITLTDVNLPDEIIRITRDLKINPQDVCFEITESATRKNPELVLEILTRLRIFGFGLAIDDFGTGYSSLFELKRIPFTEMKIDKSFIYDLENNQLNQSIVRSIAYLSHNLNMIIVAEGVESKHCLNILSEYDCDIAQGYLISKALSANDFQELMNDKFNEELVWAGFNKGEDI